MGQMDITLFSHPSGCVFLMRVTISSPIGVNFSRLYVAVVSRKFVLPSRNSSPAAHHQEPFHVFLPSALIVSRGDEFDVARSSAIALFSSQISERPNESLGTSSGWRVRSRDSFVPREN